MSTTETQLPNNLQELTYDEMISMARSLIGKGKLESANYIFLQIQKRWPNRILNLRKTKKTDGKEVKPVTQREIYQGPKFEEEPQSKPVVGYTAAEQAKGFGLPESELSETVVGLTSMVPLSTTKAKVFKGGTAS